MLELQETVQESASLSAFESDPVMLAMRVELARRQLSELLLENNHIALHIAKQLWADLRKGFDFSDVLLVKNNEAYKKALQDFVVAVSPVKPMSAAIAGQVAGIVDSNVVQEEGFVQLEAVYEADSVQLTSSAEHIMRGLHFLPVYLLDVSESVRTSPAWMGLLDPVYKTKLQCARFELKHLRQEMIASNTGLVAFVAHKYKTTSLSFDDLMQEGMVGLIKAVDRFDPERGNCFSTYAIFWIKQAISRLIVKQDKVVPLPVALAEKSSPVFEAMRSTYLQHERWPTLAELKACCDLTEQEIKTISSYYQSTYVPEMSSEEEDDGMSVMEKMQQQQFTQPLGQLIETDLVSYMSKAVASLPEKQATILAMRFGLKNHTEMTLQAVADQLQVTRERVRQIQNEALQKLRQQFGFDLMLFLEPNDT